MKRFTFFAIMVCFVNIIPTDGQPTRGRGLTSTQIDSIANILIRSAPYIAYAAELENVSKKLALDRHIYDNTKHENGEFVNVLSTINLTHTQKIDSLERMGVSRQIETLKSRSKELMEKFPELLSLRSATISTVFYRADRLMYPTKYRVTYDSTPHERIFTKVEHEPSFPGGAEAWKRFLARNLNAATPAKDGAPAGTYTVKVQFITDTQGNVSNVKAIEVPKKCPSCAAEAIKMIAKGTSWEPAVQNGHKVVFQNIQYISFNVPAL